MRMNKLYIRSLLFVIILSCSNYKCFAQTDSIVLNAFNSILEWQTPINKIDTILDNSFIGGREKFLRTFYKNLRIRSKHHDFWTANYLVTLRVENNHTKVAFKNRPLISHKNSIVQAFEATNGNWRKGIDSTLNLIVSLSSGIEEIKNTYIQINNYSLGYNFPCEYDCCFAYEKEKTLSTVKYLIEEEEYFGAIHYLKILVKKYPFDKEINRLLQNLLIERKNDD